MLTNLAHSYFHFPQRQQLSTCFVYFTKLPLFLTFFLKKSTNNNQKFIDELVPIKKHISFFIKIDFNNSECRYYLHNYIVNFPSGNISL